MAKTVKLQTSRYDLHLLIDMLHIKRAVEVGTSYGWYSYYMLRNTKLEQLWSVDSYQGKFEREIEDSSVLLAEFGERSRIVHMKSVDAAKMAADNEERFGYAYIDGEHRHYAVVRDIDSWLPLITRPGILAGHDYIVAGRTGVIPAVQAIADKLEVPIYLTRETWASWFIILGAET